MQALAKKQQETIIRKLRRPAGTALHRYSMINQGDRVLVAVSGGKDSLSLLWYLNDHCKRAPISYDIVPVHLEMGYYPQGALILRDYFKALGLEYVVEHTTYGPDAHRAGETLNPCFLCSRNRRKRLFSLVKQLNCNKLALGHNREDIVETLLLNMFYAGQISTMKPVETMFRGEFSIIRPLALTPAEVIRRFVEMLGLPVIHNPCPSADTSKRSEIRALLETLSRTNKKLVSNLFNAAQNVRTDYLL